MTRLMAQWNHDYRFHDSRHTIGEHPTRILMLGSGELGKEVTISLMRLGAWVCAADSYNGAPAAQVAHEARGARHGERRCITQCDRRRKPDIVILKSRP